jgi:nucleotide-binding universal stress UspA family protein
MDEMLGDAEMSTLKEMLEGTEYKEALDNKANEILDFYKNELESHGLKGVKTIIKGGHPVDEILKAAEEEGADMIVIGSTGHRPSDVLIGSVSREIVYKSDIPVLVAKA